MSDDNRPIKAYRETYLPAYRQGDLTRDESELLGVSTRMAGEIMARRQMNTLARSDDTAVTNALGSLIYAVSFAVPSALITGALVFLACWAMDGEFPVFFMIWLVLWGVCILAALLINRRQGLWFSPAGLAHHEIDSREHVAMFVVEKHIELLEKRWGVKDER